MQDGIVARYLHDHCPELELKLCPYRDELPPTADDFLWGHSMFDELGRFKGLDDEMGFIVQHSLAEYPGWQAEAALIATGQQLVDVATGEGTVKWLPHTRGIIERYVPTQTKAMRAARQQRRGIDFTPVNWIHVPVALGSMLLILAILASSVWRRKLDDVTLLATTVALALLGNAVICGVISGPHDRYGARLVWIATLTVLIAGIRHFMGKDEASDDSFAL
jgi:hypothetical protein